jgi:hypothetical protein
MKLSILLSFVLLWPSCVIAAKKFSRRILVDDEEALNVKMRSHFVNRARQYDTESGRRKFQLCHSCDDDVSGAAPKKDLQARRLRLLPNLFSQAKKFVRKASNATRTAIRKQPKKRSSIITANTIGPFRNMTIGEIFGEIEQLVGNNPVLVGVGAIVALTVVVPFLILESISVTTSTPILCILGFESSIGFGPCRRRLAQSTFFDKYPAIDVANDFFNTTTNVTLANATQGLIDALNVTEDTFNLIQNVTIGGIFDEITAFAGDRPIIFTAALMTALSVLLPFLVLESISQATSTPILCILGADSSISFGDCRRKLQVSSAETSTPLSFESSVCERESLACQMNNALVVLQDL